MVESQTITIETALPAHIHGRVVDIDSHLMVPTSRLHDYMGSAAEPWVRAIRANPTMAEYMDPPAEAELDATSVRTIRGAAAPGATTWSGRVAVLDHLGIDTQFVFPDVGIMTWSLYGPPVEAARCREAHNAVAAEWTRASNGRIRPAAVLSTESVDALIRDAERALASGVKALLLPHGTTIGDVSPADPQVDPFWKLAAGANVPVFFHIAGDHGFLASDRWCETDLLRAQGFSLGEVVGPGSMATVGLAASNYLSMLIFGAVFERVPDLRVGFIELGGHWVGPLMEWLDLSGRQSQRMQSALSEPPSETIARCVRVTPYHWEPIGSYLDRWPVAKVLCFSSDYPHPEGGSDPIRSFAECLRGQADDVLNGFFVDNGRAIASP